MPLRRNASDCRHRLHPDHVPGRDILCTGKRKPGKESTAILMQIAKSRGIVIFVVGHVTKEERGCRPPVWNTWWTRYCTLKGTGMPPTASCAASRTALGPPMKSVCSRCRRRGWRRSKPLGIHGRPGGSVGAVVSCSLEEQGPSFWRSRPWCC